MKRHFATLAATAALFVGGCGSGAEYSPNRPALEQAFERTLDYWSQQGLIIGIGDTLLKTVVDGAVSCGDTNVTNSAVSPTTYCPGIRTIVVSDTTYGNLEAAKAKDGIDPKAVAAAAVGHEAAHAVINRNYLTFSDKEEERVADCLSGVVVAATSPELGEQAATFLGQLNGGIHGTSQDRMDAFNAGFNGGVAGCGSDLPILLGIK